MIVCHCFAVNDRRISEIAADVAGATVADIRAACGASSDCGSCVTTIREVLAERRETAVSVA